MRNQDKQMLADHYLDFYRMAFAVLQDPSDVEDVVQEALAITMARPYVRQPYQYCVRVLYSCCADLALNQKPFSLDQMPEFASKDDEVSQRRLVRLKELRDQLPPRVNEIFDLHYDQGLSLSQIARQKGVSDTMIKKLVNKWQNRLRKQLLEIEKQEIFNIHD